MYTTQTFECFFASVARIYQVAGPEIARAREDLACRCAGFSTPLVTRKLEMELEIILVHYFDLTPEVASEAVLMLQGLDEARKHELLLEYHALTAVIVANNLTETVKACLL